MGLGFVKCNLFEWVRGLVCVKRWRLCLNGFLVWYVLIDGGCLNILGYFVLYFFRDLNFVMGFIEIECNI